MTVLIDRVARRLMDCDGKPADCLIGDGYLVRAAAAIEAMREPTPHMVAQTCVWTADPTAAQTALGLEAMVAMGETRPLGLQAACEVVRDWQSMIDTALGGTPA